MEIRLVSLKELDLAIEIIDMAKNHLKEQGIDQWQAGYPDAECIKNDILSKKGYFATRNDEILGYLCMETGLQIEVML